MILCSILGNFRRFISTIFAMSKTTRNPIGHSTRTRTRRSQVGFFEIPLGSTKKYWTYITGEEADTLPEANSSHLKIDGCKTILSFWEGLLAGAMWILGSIASRLVRNMFVTPCFGGWIFLMTYIGGTCCCDQFWMTWNLRSSGEDHRLRRKTPWLDLPVRLGVILNTIPTSLRSPFHNLRPLVGGSEVWKPIGSYWFLRLHYVGIMSYIGLLEILY